MTFRESLSKRLDIIRPSREQVIELEITINVAVSIRYNCMIKLSDTGVVCFFSVQIENFKTVHTPDTILTPDVE